jgi:hypothetical protein
MTTKYPLYWSESWPVTKTKTILKRKRSWAEAEADLERICRTLKIKDAVITSNFIDGKFNGSTAVSFCFTRDNQKLCIYCDKYFSATHNLWAIVERMRSILLQYKYNLTIYKFQN